jgi:ketopantoate reductase
MGNNIHLYIIGRLSVVRTSINSRMPYDMKSSMPRNMEKPLPYEADQLQGFLLRHALQIEIPVLILETIHSKLKTFEKSADRNKTE